MDEVKTEHPAYGIIGLSQTSSSGSVLTGSAVIHRNYISLEIREAVKIRSSYHETFMGKKLICRVSLSHAQLAEMLFSINHSEGVPCTINHVQGDTELRPEPPYESPFKESSDDLRATVQETFGKAKELAREAQELIKKGLSTKKDRERLSFLAMKIEQDIACNIPYASTCMDEKVEKNVAHAKAEIESFVDLKFKMAGIEALKGQFTMLPENTDEGKETE